MRVLQVSYSAARVSRDAVGGAEQVLAAVDAGLAARGVESAVVAPEGSRTAGALFASAWIDGPLRAAQRRAVVEAHAAALRRALAAQRFDVVHLHGLDFDRVLPDDHPPALVTLHLPPAWYAAGALQRRPGVAFACVSETQARSLPPGAPLTFVIPNGVSLESFRPAAARDGYALVLGRVAPEKGLHEALEAARRAGVPLLAGGEVHPYPEHEAYFEHLVRPRLDAERRFLGPVGMPEKARLLARARCLVVPSFAPETSSLVAMEALASGTPVVARRVGALPEVVEDGVTGFLVESVAEMADALREVGRLSGDACRRAAEARFSDRAMVERYRAAYARLAGRGAGAVRRARPRPPPLRVEEVHGLRALRALAPAWSGLADRDPLATPLARPEWLLPYCRAFGVTEPWAVAAWRGDRLTALAPLVVYDDGGRRMATLLGGGRSDWQDALVDPELAPDGAAPLLARVAERRDRYDALLLERLPRDGWLGRATTPAGLRDAQEGEDEPCPALSLPDTIDELLRWAAPHVGENVRYGRRRLARMGEVRIVRAGEGDLDAHLAALFALHAARWSSRGEPGVLADAAVQRFHREAARGLAASGRLRAYRLLVDGKAAAVWHGLAERGRLFYYVGGFDPAFRAASPGAVLLAHAAEEAMREGARELDLLRGRERYKYEWGATDRAALRRVLLPAAGERAG